MVNSKDFLDISLVLGTLYLILAKTRGEVKKCDKGNWIHFLHGHKYIKVIRTRRTCPLAYTFCEQLGGQALIIRDKATQDFVTPVIDKISSDCSFLYTFGLTNADTGVEHWVDGTIRHPFDFSNWKDKPLDTGTWCASVTSCGNGTWERQYRDDAYFLCEAIVPCAARPFIAVNGGDRLEDANLVVFIGEQNADIKCSLRGYRGQVTEVRIQCAGMDKNIGTGAQTVTKAFQITPQISGKKCVCAAMAGAKVLGSAEILVDLKILNFKNATYSERTTWAIRFGEDLKIHFDVYANPGITRHILRNRTMLLPTSIYDLHLMPRDSNLTEVEFTLFRPAPSRTGDYRIVLENGVNSHLEYRFYLNVTASQVGGKSDDSFGYLPTTAWVALLVAFIIVTAVLVFKKVAKDRKPGHDLCYLSEASFNEDNLAAMPQDATTIDEFDGAPWKLTRANNKIDGTDGLDKSDSVEGARGRGVDADGGIIPGNNVKANDGVTFHESVGEGRGQASRGNFSSARARRCSVHQGRRKSMRGRRCSMYVHSGKGAGGGRGKGRGKGSVHMSNVDGGGSGGGVGGSGSGIDSGGGGGSGGGSDCGGGSLSRGSGGSLGEMVSSRDNGIEQGDDDDDEDADDLGGRQLGASFSSSVD